MVKAENLSSKSFKMTFAFSLLCACPVGEEITNLTVSDCPFDIGQVQKIIFQRVYSTGSTRNSMTVSDAALKATWTTLFAANNGTKTSITPFIEEPITEGGDARTFGGGNTTVGGITRNVGKNPTSFSCMLRSIQSVLLEQLQDYQCENIGIYFITENGRIIGTTNSNTSSTTLYPIPIARGTMFVGDRKLGGLEEPDSVPLNWSFYPNWSLKLKEITPSDFEALIELANAPT